MSRYTLSLALLVACGRPAAENGPHRPGVAVAIEVVATSDDTPSGGDGPPRHALAFRLADGSRVAIEGEALSYAPFRDGVALVDTARRLVLVTPDGARRVLALQAGAPPVLGADGALFYVARHGSTAEVHALDVRGSDRIVASGLANAGVLAPQADGRLFFVATRAGGVAGVWLAERGAARCLSNCDLVTGQPWGDRFVPLPRDAAALRAGRDRVEWDAADGSQRSASLIEHGNAASGSPVTTGADGALHAPAPGGVR